MSYRDRMLTAFVVMVIMFTWVVSEAWNSNRVPVLNLAVGVGAALYLAATYARLKRARARDDVPPR